MASDSADAPPNLGRYQVVEKIGQGAMGVVYLGVDPVIARPVAIKVVKESELVTPAEAEHFQARFRQEAEAAGRLSHPDIVRIWDIGPGYMVMEFVEGRTLAQLLKEGAVLSVREVVAVVARVADALDYAHRAGVVHRDIKPGNVMLLAAGGVKVMDFGVARLEGSQLTQAGTVVGSVRYMAPEQMLGEKVDGRADLFSLAAVAYELLTGQPPFPGQTITEVVSRVIRGGHVPPRQADGRLPETVNRVFARAFAVKREDRYARAADFVRDLSEATRAILDLNIAYGLETETPTRLGSTLADEELARQAGPGRADTAAGLDEVEVATAPMPLRPIPAAAPAPVSPADQTILMASPDEEPPATAAPARLPVTARTVILDESSRQALLVVESDPPGAEVWLNGTKVGETPIPELEAPLGRHNLHLEAEGCEPVSVSVEMTAERSLRALTVSLPKEREDDGIVRVGQFYPFGPMVSPPRRVAGSLPAYPEAARGLEGAPVVEVWIGEKGDVVDVSIVESAGAILDTALLEAIAGWRFKPARVRGVPVTVRMTVQHCFRR